MPFRNPLTEQLYVQKRADVLNHFPFLADNQHILSFESYFDHSPQKYYDKIAFEDFLNFLNEVKLRVPHKLSQLLQEKEERLSLAITNLNTINNKNIHNINLPKEYDLSLFINENIHFDLLKLWEGPLYEFLYLVAHISRVVQGKGTEGLELFNVIDDLKKLPSEYIIFNKYENLYDHTIRNGIGHGKADFLEGRTKYTDKKGKSTEKSNDLIVTMFDDIIDVLNGFCFALKVFYFTNEPYLNEHKINIPNSVMLKELTVGASAPKWEIKACLESMVQEKRCLNIFIDTKFRDLATLRINIFHTGILAGELTNKYNTISLHIKNKLSGLAMFNADKIREVNSTIDSPILEDYTKEAYIDDSEMLFFMRMRSWKIFRKIATYRYLIQILLPIYFRHFYKKFRREFEVIFTHIHTKKSFTVVEGKIILDSTKVENAQNYVRQNYKSIINGATRAAKSDKNIFSRLWLLPAKFVTVAVYIDNVRVREWRHSKTRTTKVCSIRMNNTKTIKIPLAFPNSTEIMEEYSILWNDFLDEE